ncbi:hypothetical protein [Kitasatospora sp. NPDC088783]|uniref:hypothetical protein n=1 Tax=Kitasatospora sp. NPDC088783 TaxID=3364077 RepID=UPI0037F42ED4
MAAVKRQRDLQEHRTMSRGQRAETAAGSIESDPEARITMIPAGDPTFAIGVGLWRETRPLETFRSFAQDQLSRHGSGAPARIGRGRKDDDEVLPVVVQLVPRPDNTYNPDAISIAAPPGYGGTDHERHMAYMYDRHLVSLGGALRSLAALSPFPVGCHAFIELYEVEHDGFEPESGPNDEDGDALVITDERQVAYWTGRLRLLMPRWDRLQALTVDYARGVRSDLILPFIGHWTPWLPGSRAALASLTQEKSFDVTLRAEGDALTASYEDLPLSDLNSTSRDYFDRTVLQVREMGGRATARAEEHQGSLKVFVEDSRPLSERSTGR